MLALGSNNLEEKDLNDHKICDSIKILGVYFGYDGTLLNCACMQHACFMHAACMKMFLHACKHACTLNCMHAEAYCMHAGGYCMHADTHCIQRSTKITRQKFIFLIENE